MGSFQKDVKLGEKAQDIIAQKLREEFPTIKSIKGRPYEYDLCTNDGYTIEVKFDIKSRLTGNVGIEYRYKTKPSGIARTHAMEWIHIYYLNDTLVYSRASVGSLRAYIKSNWEFLDKKDGGDNNNSKMVLITVEDFSTVFDFSPLEKN